MNLLINKALLKFTELKIGTIFRITILEAEYNNSIYYSAIIRFEYYDESINALDKIDLYVNREIEQEAILIENYRSKI